MNKIAKTSHLVKVEGWLLIAIAFTIPLPFSIAVNSVLTICFTLVCLIKMIVNKDYVRLKNTSIWLLSSFFLIYFISGIWTANSKLFWFEIEKKLTLLIFPVTICISNIAPKIIIKTLIAFVFSCLLLFIISVTSGISTQLHNLSAQTSFFDYYTGDEIVYRINLHRVYVAIHAALGVIVLLLLQKSNASYKLLRYLFAGMLFTYIILLGSRIVTLSSFLLIAIWIILFARKNTADAKKLLFVCIFVLVAIASLLYIPKTRKSIEQILAIEQYDDVKNVDEGNGVHMRYLIWKAAKAAIQESIWMGYGAGSSQEILNKQYEKMGFDAAAKSKKNTYDTHNQYLQTWLDVGVVGFLLLISFFLLAGYQAYRSNNELYFMFLALMALCFFTENLLSNQKGIVFFAFFNSLLYFSSKNKINFNQ